MKLSLNSNKKLNQKEYGTLMKKRVFNAKPSGVLAKCGQRSVPGKMVNSRYGVSLLAFINAAERTFLPW